MYRGLVIGSWIVNVQHVVSLSKRFIYKDRNVIGNKFLQYNAIRINETRHQSNLKVMTFVAFFCFMLDDDDNGYDDDDDDDDDDDVYLFQFRSSNNSWL
jgi:hypothetical protein